MLISNPLDRRILAILEEAGQDYASALLNTSLRCTGADIEREQLIEALDRLLQSGLVQLAAERDQRTFAWRILSHEESSKALHSLRADLKWSVDEQLWKWVSLDPRVSVLLTPAGIQLSDQILRQFGYEVTEPD